MKSSEAAGSSEVHVPLDSPKVSDPANMEEAQATAPKSVQRMVFGIFLWCLLGISLIFGIRLWQDQPIHPMFLPFVGIAFAAILAYTVVMSFRSVAGEIALEFGSLKFKGAAGPVLFWNVSFVSIAYGMYLLGVIDAAKLPPSTAYHSCSVLEGALGSCQTQDSRSESAKLQSTDPAASEALARKATSKP